MSALGALHGNLAFARIRGRWGWFCFQSSESAWTWMLTLPLSSTPDSNQHPAGQCRSFQCTLSSGTYSGAFISLFLYSLKLTSFHLGKKKPTIKQQTDFFFPVKTTGKWKFQTFSPKSKDVILFPVLLKKNSIVSIKPLRLWSGEGGKKVLMGNKSYKRLS